MRWVPGTLPVTARPSTICFSDALASQPPQQAGWGPRYGGPPCPCPRLAGSMLLLKEKFWVWIKTIVACNGEMQVEQMKGPMG